MIVITLSLAVVSVFFLWFMLVEKEDQPKFRTVVVRKGNIRATVSSAGVLMPLNTVEVGSQVSGIIKKVFVEDNVAVKKDQVLAVIDDALYVDQVLQAEALVKMAQTNHRESIAAVESAKASLRSAQAYLFSAQATFKDARQNHDRLLTLFRQKIVADSVLDAAAARRDTAKGSLDMALAQVDSARTQLERASLNEQYARLQITERQANLSLAKTKRGYCTIRSPIDGIVIEQNADQGQTVAASFQAPVLFVIAQDLTRMKVEIDVSEADIGRISPGQPVEFTVDAFPEHTFKAAVSQIKNSATNIHNVVTYKVTADADNFKLMLRPGMTANASILLADVNNTLLVPNAALRYKPIPADLKLQEKNRKQRYKELYQKIVTGLSLNAGQADMLKASFVKAGRTLKNSYASSGQDLDEKAMKHDFLTYIFTSLRPVLNTEQLIRLKQFRDHIAQMEEKGHLQTVIYIQYQGTAKPVRAVIGISDEIFTQVISGDISQGDLVIIGKVSQNRDSEKSGRTGLFKFRG